jgi:hypothetical protein
MSRIVIVLLIYNFESEFYEITNRISEAVAVCNA